MNNWILLTLLYGIFKGFFECSKKKSTEKSSIFEVLGFFSLYSFLLAACINKNVFDISLIPLLIILLKSTVCIIAWIISLNILKKIEVSLYGVVNVSRVIFSILLGIVFLGEKITLLTSIGILIVIVGLVLMNITSKKGTKNKNSLKYILLLLISCFLNSIASIIDKGIMSYVNPDQLQFWFLFFSAVIYWIIILIRKEKMNFKNIKKNYWIFLTAVFLVVGDKFLFIANQVPESKVTIMTVLKQISTIEIILLGKLFFKEKNIIKKILCSLIVILGIILTIL